MEVYSIEELKEFQLQDPDLCILHQWYQEGRPTQKGDILLCSPAVRKYWLCWDQIKEKNGLLYYQWEDTDHRNSLKFLVPVALQKTILEAVHNPRHAGHPGEINTINRLKLKYHWYGMTEDARAFVRSCKTCALQKKSSRPGRAPLQSYHEGTPMGRLHIDFLGPFPPSDAGNKYILVVMDQFTKWVEAYPLPNQGAEITAHTLVHEFISKFGVPLELHSDQGRNFESELFTNVCQLLQVTKTRTTPYHPSSNGQVEGFNRTLLQMIRCYVDQCQRNWDKHLPLLTAAYRRTPHARTGFSPNRMMLGREVLWPEDLQLQTTTEQDIFPSETSYVDQLVDHLDRTHTVARQALRKSQVHQKRDYDLRANFKQFTVGDVVLVKDMTRSKGKSPKLQGLWKGPFVVTACLGPVLYRVQGQKKTSVLHHDRLKLFESEDFPLWVSRLKASVGRGSAGGPLTTDDAPEFHQSSSDTMPETEASPTASDDQSAYTSKRRDRTPDIGEGLPAQGPHYDHVTTSSGRRVRPPVRFGSLT